jgi:hypothetical protein|tara:strand:+ start:357 stop:794 length:438 start_codon:yes stop_codon:yes gene_type:complete
MSRREITLGRLRAALQRLLDGKPERIEKVGRLSLNKINNEANLGHSYIHKFEDFVRNEAAPAIEEYNRTVNPLTEKLNSEKHIGLQEIEKIRAKLKKEIALKERYRKERDDAKNINKILEQKNSSLIFRLYEIQDELRVEKIKKT